MAKYYNTTRGPIAVSLSSGKQLSIPPKTWTDIDSADEGSAMLVPMVRKGFLVRSAIDAAKPEAAVAVAAEPTPAPAEEKVVPPVTLTKKVEAKITTPVEK